MRIAIDLTALMPEATGVDNYLINLVRHLARIDHDNRYRIYVNYDDRYLFEGLLPSNFAVVPLCLRPRPVRLFFQQIVLPMAARIWDADVVHSPSFLMPRYRGRQRHLLTVYDMTFFSLPQCHIPLRRSELYQRSVLWSIRHADLVTVPSSFTQSQIHRFMPDLSHSRIRVTPPGIGPEFRLYPTADVHAAVTRLRLPLHYILYVGTIEPRKNLTGLLESYRRLASKGETADHLVLAGRLGWGYEELLNTLDTPILRDRVHLAGYVRQEDLPWFYAGAKLFVYPSLEEGFGFPPLEAMACGVPTISSRSSSLAENLEGAAELVPPDDVDALTLAMRRLLRDKSLRAQRADQGVKRAAQFQWEDTARRTLNGYRALATMNAGEISALVRTNQT